MPAATHPATGSAGQAPRRVFLTGASGFIARALGDRLRAAGCELRGVDLTPDPERGVVAGDVSRPGAWQRHAAGCDLVVHTAAVVSLHGSPDRFWALNVGGTRLALDAAVAAGAQRFVHLSSVAAFSFRFPDGVDERHPVRPNGNPYVDTKIASEQVVLQAHAGGELPCTVVRPGDVYGPRSRPWTVIPVEQIRARRLMLPARGRGIFSPVYIDNLVDALALCAQVPAAAGEVVTVSDGRGVTTADFFGRYARLLGHRPPPRTPNALAMPLAGAMQATGRALGRPTEVGPAAVAYLSRTGTYSIAKAQRLLGYAPAVGLDDGMERTGRWLAEAGLL